jgi:hypothetical protein
MGDEFLELRNALNQGLAQPSLVDASQINELFWNIVLALVARDAPAKSMVGLSALRARVAESLGTARRNRLVIAAQYLLEAERILASTVVEVVGLLGQSIVESARAYLHYKKGEYDLARAALASSERADHTLEVCHRLMPIRLHRATVACNAAYIDVRECQFAAAASRLAELVRAFSLRASRTGLTFLDPIFQASVQGHSLDYEIAYYAGELAAIVAVTDSDGLFEVQPVVAELIRELEESKVAKGVVNALKVLTRLTCEGSLADSEIHEYLRSGPGRAPELWYATCTALARRSLARKETWAVAASIISAAMTWTDPPALLSAAIRRLSRDPRLADRPADFHSCSDSVFQP